MKIVIVRRISQIFFFIIFVWFGIAATLGTHFWQLRGWPVNWFLQLDPLIAISTALSTHTLYWPLLWGLAVIILTIILGRFFCSWVCPFGSIHHFMSFLGLRNRHVSTLVELNRYRWPQAIKYAVLTVLLIMAAAGIGKSASLQIGLLDPISLATRSLNLLLLPISDSLSNTIFVNQRFYEESTLIGSIFITALLLNFYIPRFYCRFVCPLGAFFGVLDRFALWRIGKTKDECAGCKLCEKHCHGACSPAHQIRIAECVLCFNCLDECRHELISYQPKISVCGEITNPDISRRGFILAGVTGLIALPIIRLSNKVGANWHFRQIRPPGALAEEEFLKRCLKCGQCMRICPTNTIQPAGLEGGLEALWTPVLNYRIGSSGCQLNCVACGYICPTAAIRPITLSEKLGIGDYAKSGPIKIGTAFLNRGRCLPWAMDKPCIVCQENCPLSPKAIYTREYFSPVRFSGTIERSEGTRIYISENHLKEGQISGGDFYCRAADFPGNERQKIVANSDDNITIEQPFKKTPAKETALVVEIRLQRPYIDVDRCIGCGICEHECPVSGERAIRISAEGESRSTQRRLLLKS